MHTLQRSTVSLRSGKTDHLLSEGEPDFTCVTCGGTYHRPLLATVASGGQAQTYYACPRCMVKVREVKTQRSEEPKKTTDYHGAQKKSTAETEEKFKCEHFLGYLKSRPKSAPIPDECLTCEKMIQCMVH